MPGLFFESGIDKGFEEDLRRMNASVNKFTANTQKQTSQISGMFKQAGGILAGYFGVTQLVSFGKELVGTIAKFEKYNIILTNTLGSAEKAAKAMEMVKEFAASTPFSVDELTDSYVKLANRGLRPTTEEMTSMGDLASVTGKDFSQLTEAILDISNSERWKEIGIKSELMGDKVKLSFKGVERVVANTTEGVLSAVDAFGKLDGVAGANAKIAESLAGKISNIGDAWDSFMLSLNEGSGIISETVKGILDMAGALLKYQSLLNKGSEGFAEIAMGLFGQDDNLNKVFEKQKLVISKLTSEKQKSIYVNGEIVKFTTKQKMAEMELNEIRNKGINSSPFRQSQLEAELFVYKKIVTQLNTYKESKKKADETPLAKKGKDGKNTYDRELKELSSYLSDTKQMYSQYEGDLQGLTDERKANVEKEYSYLKEQGKDYLEFLQGLLTLTDDEGKRQIITASIEDALREKNILTNQDAQKEFDKQQEHLKELLDAYKTYQVQREEINKAFQDKITLLRSQGYNAEADIAASAWNDELTKLDEVIAKADSGFQKWFSENLPNMAKKGVASLQEELGKISLTAGAGFGSTPEKMAVYKQQIKEINSLILEANNKQGDANDKWKDNLEIMNGVNSLAQDIVSSFSGLDDETKNVLTGVTNVAGGAINLITAFKAVGTAVSSLEKASAILAIIGAAIKVISAISETFKKASEEREKAQVNELKNANAINLALIKQNALYKEGNELFSEDKWGSALSGLQAYNLALSYQQNLLNQINSGDATSRDLSGGPKSKMKEMDTIAAIKKNAENQQGVLAQAVSGIAIKTKDRGGLANFLGKADVFQSLLEVYPQVIKANGELDTTVLQTIIDTADLAEVDKQRLTNLISLTNEAEAAYAKFGDYVSSIFGGVGDEITKAFQKAYESGDDAMAALEVSFSNMIEKFTNDAIEFAYLQPYLDYLNKQTSALGEQYARGTIGSEQLQEGVLESLGSFYETLKTIQPQILQAYKNADELAASLGFNAAFNPDTQEAATAAVEQVVQDTTVSTAGVIQQAITEETGSELVGGISAMRISTELLTQQGADALEYAIQHLVYLKQIVLNTDYLPEIAANTRKTYEKLESI